jgi:predicted alpha-1,2-mannosidase
MVGHRVSNAWATEQHIYFVIQFSKDFTKHVFDAENKKIAVSFETKEKETVVVKVGISAVSIEGARANLEAEAPHWDFEKYKNDAKAEWEKALGKIEVKGKDEDKLAVFYSALYHTMIAPNVFSDVTGEYRGMDQKIHQADNTDVYTIFSLWDTFRGAHPLYTIIEQNKTNAFINTFLAHYEQGGELPVWELAGNETGCMIGYHSVSVITDAYVKGIRAYDADKALVAMQHSATLNKLGLEAYKSKGFIAAGDEAESVSKTLEYAYDDWCISVMAKELKNDEVSAEYIKRGQYFKNIFNPQVGFMQSKMNGGWSYGFNPSEVNFNFTEANSWQYSMFAPQDIRGLINLYGGADKFENKLDELFATEMVLSGRHQVDITGLIGQYAHGNEPSHHMAYLYNYIGKPWKTQEKINQILNEQYSNTPEGLSGNEDCGQMSAWYVLSSMGFYSVTPGLPYYAIGTPHFEEATINLENGNKFKISANNLSDQNIYIQSATLNGKDYAKAVLMHSDILKGGELVFEMGNKPNKNWGITNMPVPQIEEQEQITAVPYFSSPVQTFSDSLMVELANVDVDAEIYYSIAKGDFIKYVKPILLKESCEISTYAVKNDVKSHNVYSSYKKIKGGRSIELSTDYSNQYSGGGDNALINYLKGSTNFRTGFWQGYEGKSVVAIVDLGQIEEVNTISIGALQDIKSWIFYPKNVKISVSDNPENFKLLAEIKNEFPDNKYGAFMQEFTKKMNSPINVRYVKIEVENYGVIQDWHLGAGGTAWLFLDEITIE